MTRDTMEEVPMDQRKKKYLSMNTREKNERKENERERERNDGARMKFSLLKVRSYNESSIE